uniref:Serine/threonine-protein kinase PLK n=1 Tax=Steinernema glaseri TaxID=37863 RepID=A0A1I8A9J0_9BILA
MSAAKNAAHVTGEVFDESTNIAYKVGRFLGKGGFARCYELIRRDGVQPTNVAGKVIAKSSLVKRGSRDKIVQEIDIHKKLNHAHVVKLMTHFEDKDNLYIILELCESSSLMELQKRRKYVSEEEARYFMAQIVNGCSYLHNLHIIHRDLKLGNLFLNGRMHVKIGDFGLATIVQFDGERKKTLCGTPNYIAPEMLNKNGHSYEVDIWALGCILYTLLVGKPPFETQSLQDTYSRIKKNQYTIPAKIASHASVLIRSLLDPVPSRRPTVFNIAKTDFFLCGYHPASLPTSCLTMPPKFDFVNKRRSLAGDENLLQALPASSKSTRAGKPLTSVPEHRMLRTEPNDAAPAKPLPMLNIETRTDYKKELLDLLTSVIDAYPGSHVRFDALDDILEPSCRPVFWIGKWVDYSDRYGLGYQLSDESIGVLFNDGTKMVTDSAFKQLQYVEKDGKESYHMAQEHPKSLEKKYQLLRYFRSYMLENLVRAGGDMAMSEGDELQRLPVMRAWLRTRSAILLLLTNGILQANFFEDHEKVIVCPLLEAITCITGKGEMYTLKIEKMKKQGYPADLYKRLKYMRTQLQKMIDGAKGSAQSSTEFKGGSNSEAATATTANEKREPRVHH